MSESEKTLSDMDTDDAMKPNLVWFIFCGSLGSGFGVFSCLKDTYVYVKNTSMIDILLFAFKKGSK